MMLYYTPSLHLAKLDRLFCLWSTYHTWFVRTLVLLRSFGVLALPSSVYMTPMGRISYSTSKLLPTHQILYMLTLCSSSYLMIVFSITLLLFFFSDIVPPFDFMNSLSLSGFCVCLWVFPATLLEVTFF